MALYILVYFSSIVVSFCYAKSRDKSASIVFVLCTFLCLFLPLALRWNIGTDYKSYTRIVEDALRTGIYMKFEIGWIPIIYLIDKFDLDIHVFFLIPALFSVFIILYVVPKKYFHFCIPVYIAIAWIESFSLVRQAFAATVFLLAMKSFLRKNYSGFVFWAAVSFCFHKSIIVLAILMVVATMKWQILGRFINFIMLFGFYIVTRFVNIGGILMDKVIGITFYANYITSKYNQANNAGSGLGLLIRVTVFILFACMPYVASSAQNGRTLYKVTCVFTFFLAVGHMLAYQVHIFNRIPNLFSPFYIFFIINLSISKSRYRKITLLSIEFLIFLLFIATLINSLSSMQGGLGIVPYQSIFSR